MPRRPFLVHTTAPYHVRARTRNKEWYRLPLTEVWEIFSEYLWFIQHGFEVEILSFVLMSNHYHLLIRTPRGNLPAAMNYFQREVSRQINGSAQRINQVFGGPYGWSLILNPVYQLNVYKYIYRNPIDAGVCDRAELYPFSTLHGLLGFNHLLIPVAADERLFPDLERSLAWLNEPFPHADDREKIRKALRRRQFEVGLDRDRKRLALKSNIYAEKERRT